MKEVREVYLPLSRLLHLYVEAAGQLHAATTTFLGETDPAHAVRDRRGRFGGRGQVDHRPRAARDAPPLARDPER